MADTFDPQRFRPWKHLDDEAQRFLAYVFRRWKQAPDGVVRDEEVLYETRVSAGTGQRLLRSGLTSHDRGLTSHDRGYTPTLRSLLYVEEATGELLALDRLIRLAHERYRPDAPPVPREDVLALVDEAMLFRLSRLPGADATFSFVGEGASTSIQPRPQAFEVGSLAAHLAAATVQRSDRASLPAAPSPFRLRFTRLRAANYRAHRELDIPLAPLTVLVGPNGSGKSTLLDLVGLFAKLAGSGVAEALQEEGGFERLRTHGRQGPLAVGASMSLDYGDGRPLDARIGWDIDAFAGGWAVERERLEVGDQTLIDGVRGRALVDGAYVFHSPDTTALEILDPAKHPLQGQLRSALANVALIERDPVRDPGSGWAFGGTRKRKRLTFDAPGVLAQVAESDALTASLSTVVRALLPNVERVERQVLAEQDAQAPSRCALQVVERSGHTLDLDELSSGTRQMLLLGALHVLDNPPTAILLEEPDGGIHPGAQPALRDLLRSLATRSTVMVTTHSPSFVNLLDFEKEVVALEPTGDGTRVRSLAEAVRSRTWLKAFGPDEKFLRLASERSA